MGTQMVEAISPIRSESWLAGTGLRCRRLLRLLRSCNWEVLTRGIAGRRQPRLRWARNQTGSGDNGAHGGADLGLGDGDNSVDEGLDVGEVALTYVLGAEASARVREVSSAGQMTMEPVRSFRRCLRLARFDAVDLGGGAQLLNGCGHSGEQAAAGDGSED